MEKKRHTKTNPESAFLQPSIANATNMEKYIMYNIKLQDYTTYSLSLQFFPSGVGHSAWTHYSRWQTTVWFSILTEVTLLYRRNSKVITFYIKACLIL
jgi:hypothetical protein